MSYKSFLLELLLAAPLVVHSIYVWRRWRGDRERSPWKRSAVVFVAVLAVLFAAAVIAGAVVAAVGGDPAASTGLGALAILMAIWLDFKVSRACGK